jgi:hypothetical protein
MSFLKQSCIVLFFVASIVVGSASALCSKASLTGVWGYQVGTAVGQFTADGNGNITKGSQVVHHKGTIQTQTFTGTYLVASTCTGSLTLKFTGNVTVTANFVLDNGNKGAQIIDTTPGEFAEGIGVAEGATCGLTGTFAALLLGKSGTSPIAYVAQVILDGKGKVSGTGTFDVGGAVHNTPFTGSYAETSNCNGTIQMKPTGVGTLNFFFVVVNAGKELLLVEIDPSASVAGNMQR